MQKKVEAKVKKIGRTRNRIPICYAGIKINKNKYEFWIAHKISYENDTHIGQVKNNFKIGFTPL